MENPAITADYKNLLKRELQRRKKSHHSTLRSFAVELGLDPALLSRVLTGKQDLSLSSAKKVALALKLTVTQQRAFLESVADARKQNAVRKMILDSSIERDHSPVAAIDHDTFAAVSHLYHYAILELTFLKNFKSEAKWIAKAIGITALEAQYAIDRLVRLGLLNKTPSGLRKTNQHITTKDKEITSRALKNQQKEILQGALVALEKVPIKKRSSTGMTMAIDPSKLPEAKQMIEEFTFKLCEFLEGGNQDEVYQLGITLYPLTSFAKS